MSIEKNIGKLIKRQIGTKKFWKQKKLCFERSKSRKKVSFDLFHTLSVRLTTIRKQARHRFNNRPSCGNSESDSVTHRHISGISSFLGPDSDQMNIIFEESRNELWFVCVRGKSGIRYHHTWKLQHECSYGDRNDTYSRNEGVHDIFWFLAPFLLLIVLILVSVFDLRQPHGEITKNLSCPGWFLLKNFRFFTTCSIRRWAHKPTCDSSDGRIFRRRYATYGRVL